MEIVLDGYPDSQQNTDYIFGITEDGLVVHIESSVAIGQTSSATDRNIYPIAPPLKAKYDKLNVTFNDTASIIYEQTNISNYNEKGIYINQNNKRIKLLKTANSPHYFIYYFNGDFKYIIGLFDCTDHKINPVPNKIKTALYNDNRYNMIDDHVARVTDQTDWQHYQPDGYFNLNLLSPIQFMKLLDLVQVENCHIKTDNNYYSGFRRPCLEHYRYLDKLLNPTFLQMLLNVGLDPALSLEKGTQTLPLLCYALSQNNLTVVDLLLTQGAKIKTILDYLASHIVTSPTAVYKLLIKHGLTTVRINELYLVPAADIIEIAQLLQLTGSLYTFLVEKERNAKHSDVEIYDLCQALLTERHKFEQFNPNRPIPDSLYYLPLLKLFTERGFPPQAYFLTNYFDLNRDDLDPELVTFLINNSDPSDYIRLLFAMEYYTWQYIPDDIVATMLHLANIFMLELNSTQLIKFIFQKTFCYIDYNQDNSTNGVNQYNYKLMFDLLLNRFYDLNNNPLDPQDLENILLTIYQLERFIVVTDLLEIIINQVDTNMVLSVVVNNNDLKQQTKFLRSILNTVDTVDTCHTVRKDFSTIMTILEKCVSDDIKLMAIQKIPSNQPSHYYETILDKIHNLKLPWEYVKELLHYASYDKIGTYLARLYCVKNKDGTLNDEDVVDMLGLGLPLIHKEKPYAYNIFKNSDTYILKETRRFITLQERCVLILIAQDSPDINPHLLQSLLQTCPTLYRDIAYVKYLKKIITINRQRIEFNNIIIKAGDQVDEKYLRRLKLDNNMIDNRDLEKTIKTSQLLLNKFLSSAYYY